MRDDIHTVARDRLFLDELRPGQEEAVRALLDGQDTLAVMPTGYGKSAIYQIAGALIDGPTVVVSPLISLQHDQVEALSGSDVGEAAKANSTLSPDERRETFDRFGRGELEFLFLAPEQFNNPRTLERLAAIQPSLFVVDEAHCITAWGHDFRPEYLRLGAVADALGHPRVLALTATASPPVRAEILERLRMRDPFVIVRGFDRPNLSLAVARHVDERSKWDALVDRVADASRTGGQVAGIVYAATRRHTEEVAAALRERGIAAEHYHAGLTAADRARVHNGFLEGDVAVVVATTAFGMGIDKPDVRFVFHLDVAESLDAYYQEIGRAGRDGAQADAVLFFRPEDLALRRFLGSRGQVDVDQVLQVAEAVGDEPLDPSELEVDLSRSKLTTAVSRLETVGAVELLPTGEVVAAEDAMDGREAAVAAVEAEERRRSIERSRLEMVRGYAETLDCRRQFLLNYFGEAYQDPCDNCDNCLAGRVITEDRTPFPLQSRVAHSLWGEGLVMRYEGDKLTVLFDQVGYRTLALDVVLDRELLWAVEPAG